jgi:regulator of protease activity HflC (stomatin/prohibitin superfamily)
VDNAVVADLRIQAFDLASQEVLTKDFLTAKVEAVIYLRILNPTLAITSIENTQQATKLSAITTLREIFGMKTLNEILSKQHAISNVLKNRLNDVTKNMGVSIEKFEM